MLLPAARLPILIVEEPSLTLRFDGRIICALALDAGYAEQSNGCGHGYVILAVTLTVKPAVGSPDVVRLTDHGIITAPQYG
jgi:hypothetical protein